MANSRCAASDCHNELSGRQRRWCSTTCRQREHSKQTRAAERAAKDDPTRLRQGPCFDAITDLGLYDMWKAAELTYAGVRSVISDETGFDYALPTVISALQAHRVQRRLEAVDDDWQMADDIAAMLTLEPPNPDDPEALETWLDTAVEGFLAFERKFFRTPRGPYIRKGFHRRWIRETLRAIVTGGSILILAPPRHGKSELMCHFCVWLIARDPDIRILWVAGNGDLAEDMVTMVRTHLESNRQLIEAVLPPSKSFVPRRTRSKVWTASKFTVDCREAISKASTMIGIGRGQKILSKDVDFLVADDIEDFASTEAPAARTKTRTWFLTQLDSRVEEHTAVATIGSRQHVDDLYGYLLEDDGWHFIVDRAHDLSCAADPHDDGAHTACMLFPEMRSYRWYRLKRQSAAALGQEHLHQMVYDNNPKPDGLTFYTRELMAPAYNHHRPTGLMVDAEGKPIDAVEVSPGETRAVKLVAGLDPSATRYQAAFLWGVDLWTDAMTEFMIDLDNRIGGGTGNFLVVANEWLARYGLRHWVIEINLYRTGFLTDKEVMAWCAANSIVLEAHDTQGNKHDPWFGVGAMKSKYEASPPLVDLPYGTPDARAKTELYVSQALRFTDNAEVLKRKQTDVLMSSWFPQKVIRRWKAEALSARPSETDPPFAGFDVSDYDLEAFS